MINRRPTVERSLAVLEDGEGQGIVRISDRFDTDPADLWSALTDPARLDRWLGELTGELREGGEFDAHFHATGWQGHCRVEVCDAPHRLLIRTESADEPGIGFVELRLSPDQDGTRLTIEDRGVPLDTIAAYGAGDQVHLEDLASHLAGGGRCDARPRWESLVPEWDVLAADLDVSVVSGLS